MQLFEFTLSEFVGMLKFPSDIGGRLGGVGTDVASSHEVTVAVTTAEALHNFSPRYRPHREVYGVLTRLIALQQRLLDSKQLLFGYPRPHL